MTSGPRPRPSAGDATPSPVAEATALCVAAGLDGPLAPIVVREPGPLYPGPFRVDVAAPAVVAAATAAVAAVAAVRRTGGGRPGAVEVSARAAQVAFRSERYLQRDGVAAGVPWAGLSGDYRCADGWIKVHANFAHHGSAAAAAFGVPADRAELAAALRSRRATEAETAIVDAGGAAAALRSAAEWAAHPQGRAEAMTAPLRVTRSAFTAPTPAGVGPGPWPWPGPAGSGPLSGVRVLDLTRVIAGPVCGRVLASYGADVLAVTAAHLPQIEPLLLDTGVGKRSTLLDLRRRVDRADFERLLTEADVLIESYRDGALAGLGYGRDDLRALRPGLVTVEVRAYSATGPWRTRRGYDSLVQFSSGIAEEAMRLAGAEAPVPLPCQALDHATGWLGALGALGALLRRHREGGSWSVEVSLAATANWLQGLGRLTTPLHAVPDDPTVSDIADLLVDVPSDFGVLRHVRAPGHIDAVAAPVVGPPPRLGSAPPVWRPPGIG